MKTTRSTSTLPPTRARGLGCVTQANWPPETRGGSPRDVCGQHVLTPCSLFASHAKMRATVDIRAQELHAKNGFHRYVSRHRYVRLRPSRTEHATELLSDPMPRSTEPKQSFLP